MTHRVLLIGASGVFGRRLAARLALWPDLEIVLAARRTEPLAALRLELIAAGAPAKLEVAGLDRDAPDRLAALNPWAVVDCAGPFQGSDDRLARAALAAGAHYLDLADGRAFVAGFAAALDADARRAGRLAATGASSSPALTAAAVEQLTQDWRRIDRVEAAISPGARAVHGASVMRAALSWAGQPVRVFTEGAWRTRAGAGLLRRRQMPGLGRRWVALAETPDLDLLPARFDVREEALFLAGPELGVETLSLWGLGALVRLRLLRTLSPLAPVLVWLAASIAPLGADRGGMSVTVEGLDASGAPARARWSLWAAPGVGPSAPILPATAILRALKDGRLAVVGAQPPAGLASLQAILAETKGLAIETRIDRAAPGDPSLSRRLMGEAFDEMPSAVRAVHAGGVLTRLEGYGRARGASGLAAAVRRVAGMPGPGLHPDLTVEIATDARGEIWTRHFGRSRFRSRLRDLGEIGRFEEAIGPLAFAFDAEPDARGFRWRFVGWRFGPLPLPRALAPHIHARSFARDGAYRFSVAVAHTWIGLVLAYAGRLEVESEAQPGRQTTSATLRSRRRLSAARP